MSAQLALPFCRPSISSAGDSPARTCPAPDEEQGSTAPARGSGGSSSGSLARRARGGSSSKMWPAGPNGGCLLCGDPLGHSGMRACPWASPPVRWARGTDESGSSSSPGMLPTLKAVDGSGHYSGGAWGLLPTLLGGDGHKAARDQGTVSLRREALRSCPRGQGCLLDPGWCEAFMGFPEGWTDPGSEPAGPPPAYEPLGSTPSGTASSRRKSSRSGA